MGVFVLFITTLGFFMFRQQGDDFDKEYYEKGLAFDSVYVKQRRVILDHTQPEIKFTANEMTICVAGKGTVHFSRPSDGQLDRVFSFNSPDCRPVNISLGGIARGRWNLEFEWANKGKKYLYDKEVYIQ